MKLKKNYLVLFASILSAPITVLACPTCIGRVQENSSTAFFHEEDEIKTEKNHMTNTVAQENSVEKNYEEAS